jgi:hypothetical protein
VKFLINHCIDEALLAAFRFRTRKFLRMEDAPGEVPSPPTVGAGYLYLHIPFCESLCPFCSFHRVQYSHAQAARYFHSLREEVRRYYEAGFRFKSAYFGGGTPTIEPDELVKTIQLVRDLFGVREISVETNPKDLRPEILLPLRDAGVTRVSVGVQSFDDRLLQDMERFEKYGSGVETSKRIRQAAPLFPTFNVDLIFKSTASGFGMPGARPRHFARHGCQPGIFLSIDDVSNDRRTDETDDGFAGPPSVAEIL